MQHQDILQNLHNTINLGKKIKLIHQHLTHFVPFIDRVSFAIYDENTDLLRTFLLSEFKTCSLKLYEAKLSDVPSLKAIKEERRLRIIEDISQIYNERKHIKEQSFQSSYMLLMVLALLYISDIRKRATNCNTIRRKSKLFNENFLRRINGINHSGTA